MTPVELRTARPSQALRLLGVTTLLGALGTVGYLLPVGATVGRSQTTAAAVVLFVTALSCFGFGVLAGLLTRRMAPMLLGYLPGLVVVLLTGLQIAEVPQHGRLTLPELARDSWLLLNPLLWLPFIALAIAWRTWSTSPEAPSSAPTSGATRSSTRSRTTQ